MKDECWLCDGDDPGCRYCGPGKLPPWRGEGPDPVMTMCKCGHDVYSHYMCSTPERSRCLVCECKQFTRSYGKKKVGPEIAPKEGK